MAKIPLRSYLQEIEGMIDKGQIDEAVAHCRHILQVFPKLLAAYRLLGKAYMESQRYADAADLFQRVLSSVPDDFVAHVGMSIIREDEKNMDAAIGHMERAFEVQPYNAAIQDELRRLYGRRDGIEPPKVRLTRGALARMYARGHLHQQAIAELRSALAEDPQRPDLQVLLARMYFLAGQRVEAVETCSMLLKKLPYCLEANRILLHILPDTGRKEDADLYQQHIMALDPYLIHANPQDPSSDGVPEGTVILEKLDYLHAQQTGPAASQPAWAASLGISMDSFTPKEEEKLPSWLSAGEGSSPEAAEPEPSAEKPAEQAAGGAGLPEWMAAAESEPSAGPAGAETFPDWMKDAGWQPSSGEAVEIPPAVEPLPAAEMAAGGEEASAGEEGISAAEIPDWLRAIAPEGALEEAGGPELASGALTADGWTADTLFEPEQQQEQAAPTNQAAPAEGLTPAEPTPAVELPDWLAGLAEEAETGSITTPEETVSPVVPETISQVESTAEIPEEPAAEPALPSGEALPDWLSELSTEEEASIPATEPGGVEPAEMVPDWLQETVGPEQPVEEELISPSELPPAEEPQPAMRELPDWLSEIEKEGETAEPELMAPSLSEQDSGTDWLQELAEQQVPTEAEVPEWIQEQAAAPEPPAAEMTTIEPTTAEIPAGGPPTADRQAAELTAESISQEPAMESQAPAMPDLSDQDSGMAWLEALAARQGVPEEELTTRPEERTEEIPDWIQELAPEPPEPPAAGPLTAGPQTAEPQTAEMPVAEIPAAEAVEIETPAIEEIPAVAELPAEEKLPTVVEPAAEAIPAAEEIPDWLQAPAPEPLTAGPQTAEEPTAEMPAAEIPAAEPPVERVEAPAFVLPTLPQEEVLAASAEVEAEPAPAAELPDWLLELEAPDTEAAAKPSMEAVEAVQPAVEAVEALPEQPAATPGMPDLSDQDAAMAWLESLAAKQGVPEEELTSKPEERLETPPDWIQELASKEQAAAEEEGEAEPAQAAPEPPAAGPLTAETQAAEMPVAEIPAAEPPAIESPAAEMPVAEQKAEPVSKEAEPIPDWLQQMAETAPQEAAPIVVEPPAAEQAPELPDWLKETAPAAEEEPAWTPPSWASKAAQGVEPVDINTASLVELEKLPGIGFILAQNILAYREQHGSFTSMDEVASVPGISPAVLNEVGGLIKIEGQPEPQIEAELEGEAAQPSAPEAETSAPGAVVEPQAEAVSPFVEAGPALESARRAIAQGQLEQAASRYMELIQKEEQLGEVITDLRKATGQHPADANLWQALGDAYVRSNQLQEALEAYDKAMEQLK